MFYGKKTELFIIYCPIWGGFSPQTGYVLPHSQTCWTEFNLKLNPKHESFHHNTVLLKKKKITKKRGPGRKTNRKKKSQQ